MARFDIYANSANWFLLDVRTDLIPDLGTRLVVPLMLTSSVPRAVRRLHPIFQIDGRPFVMATQLMGPVPTSELRRPTGNLFAHYDKIVAAIDMIFLGF